MKTLYLTLALIALALSGCAGIKAIPFTSDTWTVNNTTGNIENADSTLSFTLSSSVETELPLIASETDAGRYKRIQPYLNKICAQLGVDCDSILFYAPTRGIMIVETNENRQWKPRSQSFNLLDEKPYTAWVRNDDTETPGNANHTKYTPTPS